MDIEKELERVWEKQMKQYAMVKPDKRGPVITNIRMNKLVVPDRKSNIKIGHFHRIVRITHDTAPNNPYRGVLFVLVEHASDCAVCWKIRVVKYYMKFNKISEKYCKNIFILHPFSLESEIEQMGYHYSPPGPDGMPMCNCDKCITPEIYERIAMELYEKNQRKNEQERQLLEEKKREIAEMHDDILGDEEFVIENPCCSGCGDTCEHVKKIVINSEDYIKLVVDWYDEEGEGEEQLVRNDYDYLQFEINGDEITFCYKNTKIVYDRDGVKNYTFDCWDFNPVCI